MNYRRVGRWAAAAGAVALAGGGLYWLRERRTEKPDYVPVATDGAFELRRYPPILTAGTVQPGARDRALGQGFGVLAGYIFGEGRDGDEIPMTVPVIARRIEGRGWEVRFVMPKLYTRDTLPAADEGVEIGLIPARRIAAVRFAGKADDALLAMQEANLRGWIERRGDVPAGPAEHAFFNSPFIPGAIRHNEVWIPIE